MLQYEDKLKTLGELSRFDITGLPQLFNPQGYLKHAHFIYPAVGFKGRCANLFRTPLSKERQLFLWGEL